MQTVIRSARLWMRRGQPADLEGYHALVSDFQLVQMTASWPWPPDRSFTARRATAIDPARGMGGPVFRGQTMVGMMAVIDGALGYAIARAHWGQGYATEIGRALIAHVWQRYHWDEITADVLSDNPASARVLEKLGFEEQGPTTCKSVARGPGDFPARAFRLARP